MWTVMPTVYTVTEELQNQKIKHAAEMINKCSQYSKTPDMNQWFDMSLWRVNDEVDMQ